MKTNYKTRSNKDELQAEIYWKRIKSQNLINKDYKPIMKKNYQTRFSK